MSVSVSVSVSVSAWRAPARPSLPAGRDGANGCGGDADRAALLLRLRRLPCALVRRHQLRGGRPATATSPSRIRCGGPAPNPDRAAPAGGRLIEQLECPRATSLRQTAAVPRHRPVPGYSRHRPAPGAATSCQSTSSSDSRPEWSTELGDPVAVPSATGAVALHQSGTEMGRDLAIDGAEHGQHRHDAQSHCQGQRLIEQTQAVTQAAIGSTRQRQWLVVRSSDPRHPECAASGRRFGPFQTLKAELQTARQHRDRRFLRIGGGQQELDVRRRLFQRLQQCVGSWRSTAACALRRSDRPCSGRDWAHR